MVKAAVFLAAGEGKRFDPISQFIPKELLLLGRIPVLGWLVREVVNAGVMEVVLVSAPGKRSLEKYFRRLAKEYGLRAKVVRQQEPLGTADAVFKAQKYLRWKPFLVYYCDEVWLGEPSRAQQLLEAYREIERPICAVVRVDDRQLLSRLGVIKKGREERPGLFIIERIVEKPKGKSPSNLALVSGMVLEPSIFEAIEEAILRVPGEREVYLTDALNLLCRTVVVYALELEGEWVDAGTLERYPQAFVQMTLADPVIGEEFRKYLEDIFKA